MAVGGLRCAVNKRAGCDRLRGCRHADARVAAEPDKRAVEVISLRLRGFAARVRQHERQAGVDDAEYVVAA